MTEIHSVDEFLEKFKVNDQLWRVSFEDDLKLSGVYGPLTIVEIKGHGDKTTVNLRDNNGEQTNLSLSDLLCKHCAVFDSGSEAWGWFKAWEQKSGRA